jgi:serine/threonine-protein kinase HipA
MSMRLVTFCNRQPLGEITLEGLEDRYGLDYDPAWPGGGGFPVSPHLHPGNCSSESVRRFLANLLPEGKWLEELALSTHISRANVFGLVASLGAETTGALTFYSADAGSEPPATSFRQLLPEELTERISRRQDISIALWDGKPRLSVAGVQDKLPVVILPDGRMGFGEGELASTHILKFGMSRAMHLVVNEYFCMKLARAIKLPVAEVELARFGEPVLVVRRFDRQWSGSTLVNRLHLIDGCQMLDLPPTYKYERPFGKGGDAAIIRAGASLPLLFAACRKCCVPAAAMRDLLNWELFQLLIGNSDAHGKNISFFVGPAGINPAPAYDLICLDMYGDIYDRDLAMAVGDTFSPDDIQPYQLAEMCEACSLPQRQVARTLTTLCRAVLQQLDVLDVRSELKPDEADFTAELAARIRSNAGRYLGLAALLPQVKL